MTSLEGGGDAKAISKSWLFKPLHQDTMDYDMDYVHRGFPKTLANPPSVVPKLKSADLCKQAQAAAFFGPRWKTSCDYTSQCNDTLQGRKLPLPTIRRVETALESGNGICDAYWPFKPTFQLLVSTRNGADEQSRQRKVLLQDGRQLLLDESTNNSKEAHQKANETTNSHQSSTTLRKDHTLNKIQRQGLCRTTVNAGLRIRQCIFEYADPIQDKLTAADQALLAYQLATAGAKRERKKLQRLVIDPSNVLWNIRTRQIHLQRQTNIATDMGNDTKEVETKERDQKAVRPRREFEAQEYFALTIYQMLSHRKVGALSEDGLKAIRNGLAELPEKCWRDLIQSCIEGGKVLSFRELRDFILTNILPQYEVQPIEPECSIYESVTTFIQNNPREHKTIIERCLRYLNRQPKSHATKHAATKGLLYTVLGVAYIHEGFYESGLLCFAQSEALYKHFLSPLHPYVTNMWSQLAAVYTRRHEHSSAILYATEANTRLQELHGLLHDKTAVLHNYLALGLAGLSRSEEAAEQSLIAKLLWLRSRKCPRAPPTNAYLQSIIEEDFQSIHDPTLGDPIDFNELNSLGFTGDPLALAQEYESRAHEFTIAGQYKSALEECLKGEALLKGGYSSHPTLCDIYSLMGLIYFSTYEYKTAVQYYLRAESIAVQNPQRAEVLTRICVTLLTLYTHLGDTAKQSEYTRKIERASTPDTDSTFTHEGCFARMRIGIRQHSQGQYVDALESFHTALQIATNGDEGCPQGCVQCIPMVCSFLGRTYITEGDYASALRYLKLGEQYILQTTGDESLIYARICLDMGGVYIKLGKTQQGLSYFHEAERLFPSNSKYRLRTVDNLWKVYTALGDVEKAAEFAQKYAELIAQGVSEQSSDEINDFTRKVPPPPRRKNIWSVYEDNLNQYVRLYGSQHPLIAYMHNNLGLKYFQNNDFGRAQSHFEQAKQIGEHLQLSYSAYGLAIYTNLGSLYKTQHNYMRAVENYLLALQVSEYVDGPNSSTMANIQMMLSESYLELKEYDKSIQYCLLARGIYVQLEGEYSFQGVRCCIPLHKTYTQLNRHAEALECVELIQQIFIYHGQYSNPILAVSYGRKAANLIALGEYQRAVDSCLEGERILWEYFGGAPQLRHEIYPNLIEAYTLLGNIDAAAYYQTRMTSY